MEGKLLEAVLRKAARQKEKVKGSKDRAKSAKEALVALTRKRKVLEETPKKNIRARTGGGAFGDVGLETEERRLRMSQATPVSRLAGPKTQPK